MKRKRLVSILLFVLLLCVIGGGIFGFFAFRRAQKAKYLEAILTQADAKIEKGLSGDAAVIISRIGRLNASARQWLSLLKRCYYISAKTGDYTLFKKYAGLAVKNIPGNEDLWACVVFADLKKPDKPEKTVANALKHLASSKYDMLKAETLLRWKPDMIPGTAFSDIRARDIMGCGADPDPEKVELILTSLDLEELFPLVPVLWLLHEKPEKAYGFMKQKQSVIPEDLQLFTAFDSGHFDEALVLLEDVPEKQLSAVEKLLLKGDIFMEMQEYAKAKDLYKQTSAFIEDTIASNNAEIARLEGDSKNTNDKSSILAEINVLKEENAGLPSVQWIPYLNLAWLASILDEEGGFSYLLKAYDIFPEKKEILLPLGWYLVQQRQYDDAQEKLELFIRKNPKDPDISLLYLVLPSSLSNPERYRASLWELYNRYPDHTKIVQYFLWYLLGLKDKDGLSVILKKSKEIFGNAEWIYFYEGMLNSLYPSQESSGIFLESAKNSFLKAEELRDRWETLFNLGVISIKQGNLGAAQEFLEKSYSLLLKSMGDASPAHDGNALGSILVNLAWISMQNERYDDARKKINTVLSIEPTNLEALLMLRKLEGGSKN
ncbi:MAG: tetratricopeptide repeat protein [Spirochaetales bacterium]|nr:MAG: tetratricopeptide repeat protein [Spirochaetales bacterium]